MNGRHIHGWGNPPMECNMNAPIYRAASKTTETGPKRAPEDPLKMVPERLTFIGFLRGQFSPAYT